VKDPARYRLDDLRRFACALAAGLGVEPARGSALATHLLWFDAAGAPSFGIGALGEWLEQIEAKGVDPAVSGRVVAETVATAVFDGQRGLGPLVLSRAGALAVEKARDAGVGLIRVTGAGNPGPAAPVAADMAVGPVAGFLLGPGPEWTVALPSDEGLPTIFDPALGDAPTGARKGARATTPGPPLDLMPWARAVLPDGDWLVCAVGVRAIESLAGFRERVDVGMRDLGDGPGRLLPGAWEARRKEARERGIRIAAGPWKKLAQWAERLGVALPEQANSSNSC
jgi:LDH2 family malate/lactate/ureidoglycolate dehydrogenase